MKYSIVLTLALTVFTMTACKTAPSADQLATIKTVASEAAYVGASYDLAANPGHRPAFTLTQQALAAMVAADTYTPEKLQAALANLPVLTGQSGAILDGGVTLYVLAVGFLDIDGTPRVKAMVLGIQDGLARALAVPTSSAPKAMRPPLPPQCTVPAR